MEKEIRKMIDMALQARAKSYAPYSNFHVGACLQDDSGEFYLGCNIENAGYTATNCAERTAFFKAVSDGKRHFKRIAIMGGNNEDTLDFCPPCGVCLQVMMEFCNPDTFQIILGNSDKEYKIYLLKELLPMGFGPQNIDNENRG
jgi:cytidine deaminase